MTEQMRPPPPDRSWLEMESVRRDGYQVPADPTKFRRHEPNCSLNNPNLPGSFSMTCTCRAWSPRDSLECYHPTLRNITTITDVNMGMRAYHCDACGFILEIPAKWVRRD